MTTKVVCYNKMQGTGCFQCYKHKVKSSAAGGNKKRKRVEVKILKWKVRPEVGEEWGKWLALTRIMEMIEEWVEDQKEMINKVERIQRGHDMQRIEEREWQKQQREWREEQRQWRREEREWRKRIKNKKNKGVQTSGDKEKGKDKEVKRKLDWAQTRR